LVQAFVQAAYNLHYASAHPICNNDFLESALAEDDYDAAHKLDQMLRGHLKDLKSTKLSREADLPSRAEITPAEWATALLERLAEAERRGQAK